MHRPRFVDSNPTASPKFFNPSSDVVVAFAASTVLKTPPFSKKPWVTPFASV